MAGHAEFVADAVAAFRWARSFAFTGLPDGFPRIEGIHCVQRLFGVSKGPHEVTPQAVLATPLQGGLFLISVLVGGSGALLCAGGCDRRLGHGARKGSHEGGWSLWFIARLVSRGFQTFRAGTVPRIGLCPRQIGDAAGTQRPVGGGASPVPGLLAYKGLCGRCASTTRVWKDGWIRS